MIGYPFPALLPFQVLHYPIPQALRGQPRTPWATWPGAMRPRVRRWKEQVSTPPSAGNQIYVHVPFCPFYCNFCPLYKTKDPRHRTEDIKEKYVATVLREIENYAKNPAVQGRKFRTLYFGGGTPTQLSPDQLGRIVDRIRTCLWLDDDTEITLEGVATQMLAPGYLESCREHGFNRISFGVQSLDPNVRRKVGRGEKPQDYERLVELVDDELPFNVDLMIGLPEQSLESHERDLKTILGWNVGSVDIYSYWMVPGTRTFEHVAAGRRSPPRYGQSLLEMRQLGKERLTGEGFRQISGEAYVRGDRDVFMQTTFGGGGNGLNTALGLGPSAIGFLDGTLYQNVADLDRYFEAIDDQVVPVQVAGRLDVATARRRAAVLGLQRLSVPRAVLGPRAASLFARWAGQGLLELRGDIYHLTSEGSLWYNQMQLALLTLTEQRKLVGLLGTPRQQAQALASHRAQPTDPTEQLLALIRDRGGVAGSLRVWGYKALVQLKRLPVFDQRAIGFSGPLQDRTRRSRTKEAR